VDTASVHIFIDGLDVTVEAILTPHFVTFEPRTPLTDGEHTVRVVAADIVGNSAEASWKISVNARHDLVTSFESNVTPQSSHISMIRPLHLILRAQAGGRATYSVGSLVTNGPMKETSPGQYEADYTPDGAASAQNAPVTASFATASGASTTVTLDTAVTVDAPAAMRPTITDPKPNDVVPGHCVIAGIAAPNATVLVTVTFKSPAMGDLYRRTGKAASTEVLADETGHWRTEDLKLNAGGFMSHSGGTVYTATAVVVDATGQQSARDLIRFRQK
jgi:hypothetical protein